MDSTPRTKKTEHIYPYSAMITTKTRKKYGYQPIQETRLDK